MSNLSTRMIAAICLIIGIVLFFCVYVATFPVVIFRSGLRGMHAMNNHFSEGFNAIFDDCMDGIKKGKFGNRMNELTKK